MVTKGVIDFEVGENQKMIAQMVRDFGAKGTGLTGDDDTKAIQDALNKAGSVASSTAGAVVVVPHGAFRVKGRLSVPSFVELRGNQDYISFGQGASSILLSCTKIN